MIVINHEILGAIDTDRHRAYRIKVGCPYDPLFTVCLFALKKYYGQVTGNTSRKMLLLRYSRNDSNFLFTKKEGSESKQVIIIG